MNTADTCKRLGITRRQLAKYVRDGCPVRKKKPPKGKGGKPRNDFILKDVRAWLLDNKRKRPKVGEEISGSASMSAPSHQDTGATQAANVTGATSGQSIEERIQAAINDLGLEGALARLRTAEKRAYGDLVLAIKKGLCPACGRGQEPPSVIRARQAAYLDAHKVLKETELKANKILQERGELLPLDVVLKEAAQIDQAIRTRLLTIPKKMAVVLAAETDAHEIQGKLREEIDDALRNLSTKPGGPDK